MSKGSGRIVGVVLNEDGSTPRSACKLAIELQHEPSGGTYPEENAAQTDKRGLFKFPDVRPGLYELWILRSEDGRVIRKPNIEVHAAQTTTVKVRFETAVEHTLVPLYLEPDHVEIKEEAISILSQDNYTQEASFLGKHFSLLSKANWDEDERLGTEHFYHWSTGSGYHVPSTVPWYARWMTCTQYRDAATVCQSYMDNVASSYWQESNVASAIYWLGRAGHLVEDLTNPHHAECVGGLEDSSHASFEHFIHSHWSNIAPSVLPAGIYETQSPREWVSQCAVFAHQYWSLVDGGDENDWMSAARPCIEYAKQKTAGFFKYCLESYFSDWRTKDC